jgi:hypothetical protein
MAVFTDLERRVSASPFDMLGCARRLSACQSVAQRIPLVHVSGRERPFETTVNSSSHAIPTSEDTAYYTELTRRAEDLLGLPRSAYFYAGRAHPAFGNVAMAFAADCQADHTGSATPFDTGGLMHPGRPVKLRLEPTDGEAERAQYGKDSVIPLDRWRDVFGQVLAAYFENADEYWLGRPNPHDPEGLYELNDDWRAWTFEVRFSEGQSVHDRAAWCADESVMEALRRLQDEQEATPPADPPTALDLFLQGVASLEPTGTPEFCKRVEQWVYAQVGL